ncbi:hypothetical protein BGZ83_009496 [Gryganskiella cystojenkinii]|nr:hypothetical protein BGZ83_009496 [Gryganskiella cystojenkinii]
MHSNRTAVADELLVTLDTDTDMEDLILDDSVMGHPSIDVERQTVVEQSILLSTLARLEQEVEQLREANQGLQADLDLFREQTDQQEQDYEQRLQALRVQHEQELTSLQRQETQRVSLLQSTLKTQLTTLRALHQETRQDQLHAEADLATLLLYLQGRRGGHAAEQISLQERASWFSLSPDTVDSMDPPAMMTTTSAVPLAGSKSSLSSTSSDLICVTAMGQSCLRFLQQLDMALSNLSATLSFKEGELPDIGDLVMQHGIVPDSDQNQNQNHLKRRRQQKRRSDCSSVSSGKTIVAQQQQQQQHQQQPRRQLFLPHQHLVSAIAPSVRQLIENHPVQSVSNDIEIRKHIQEKEVLQQRLSEQQIHHQLEVERIKQECIRLYRESLQEVRAELLDKMRQRRRQKRKL